MLDCHAVTGTPGAATVLGATFATIAPGGDGQSVAGVPVAPGAALVIWGGLSVAANTIGAIRLQSQDMVDPLNGEYWVAGAASLINIYDKWTNLPYKSGLRAISMGTNTGVTAAVGYFIDHYPGGPTIMGSRVMPAQVMPQATTFGGALTARTWGQQAFAPATALPNGKYAILGAITTAVTDADLIRFQHVDFGQFMPGFPVTNPETISTSTWDKVWKDTLLETAQGYQFVRMSEITGKPCCPVFSVTNNGTGLNIWMISNETDTPVVTLNLAKVE